MTVSDSFFFIIGAQRSGSTFLYQLLDEHPSVCMAKPLRPEPKYFCRNSSYGDLSQQDYMDRFFSHRKNETIFGEKSTSYYEDPTVPEHISKLFPSGKLILIVRNPIDRAISNYRFSVENGYEQRSIDAAFDTEDDALVDGVSVSPFNYLGRGLYSKFLKNFDAWFSPESIKVVVLEEFIANPMEVRNDLYSFVGAGALGEKVSVSDSPVNASSGEKTELSQQLRYRLKKYYEQSIEELQLRLGRRIEAWDQ